MTLISSLKYIFLLNLSFTVIGLCKFTSAKLSLIKSKIVFDKLKWNEKVN